jgi:hypothetical protein
MIITRLTLTNRHVDAAQDVQPAEVLLELADCHDGRFAVAGLWLLFHRSPRAMRRSSRSWTSENMIVRIQ